MREFSILCVIYLQMTDGLALFRKLVINMLANSKGGENSRGNSLGHPKLL